MNYKYLTLGMPEPGPAGPECWAQMGLICYFKGNMTCRVPKSSAFQPGPKYDHSIIFLWGPDLNLAQPGPKN